MSFSAHDVRHQSRSINAVLSQIPGTCVPIETNKRVIVRCTNQIVAYTVAKNLRANRFHCEIAKGLKSAAFYVNVSFNSPY